MGKEDFRELNDEIVFFVISAKLKLYLLEYKIVLFLSYYFDNSIISSPKHCRDEFPQKLILKIR